MVHVTNLAPGSGVNNPIYGCIPVIVQDDVSQPFDDILPYHKVGGLYKLNPVDP
jgi:hypothetical protein